MRDIIFNVPLKQLYLKDCILNLISFCNNWSNWSNSLDTPAYTHGLRFRRQDRYVPASLSTVTTITHSRYLPTYSLCVFNAWCPRCLLHLLHHSCHFYKILVAIFCKTCSIYAYRFLFFYLLPPKHLMWNRHIILWIPNIERKECSWPDFTYCW